jgi:hypothetical protein
MANWNEIKKTLRNKIIQLNDNKEWIAIGKQEDVINRLEVKLGKTREAILKIMNEL